MTSTIMNAQIYPQSMTKVLWLIAVLGAAPCAIADPAARAAPCAADAVAKTGYPDFCSIPAAPKDVRGPVEFKSAVVETRVVGLRTSRLSAAESFGLAEGQADAFTQAARAEASWPDAEPAASDTESFAAAARARANPQARSRR